MDKKVFQNLMSAAKNGHETCLESLIRSETDVNAADDNGYTAVIYAAEYNSDICLSTLINAGADVNLVDNFGDTALTHAVENGYERCLDLLITAGADVNVVDSDGDAAVTLTVLNGHDRCLKCLIDAGADVKSVKTSTPIRQHWRKIFLSKTRGDIDEELTLLHIAAFEGYHTCLDLLIKAGADVNALTSSGETPLILASRNGHLQCVSLLTLANADKNVAENKYGNTALMAAVDGGFFEVVDAFLSTGADVNAVNKHGQSALSKAQTKRDYYITVQKERELSGQNVPEETTAEANSARCCLDSLIRANIESDPNANEAVLIVAAEWGLDNFVHHLIQLGVDENAGSSGKQASVAAASNGHIKIAEALVAAGADVNVADHHGYTAVTCAARRADNNFLKYLIRVKADVNIPVRGGRTALMLASSCGDDESVELLLAAGADVNANCMRGSNPLSSAASAGHLSILKRLLEAGADVVACADFAAFKAAQCGKDDCLRLLIDAGANINAKHRQGFTPLISACSQGHDACANMLLQSGADVNMTDNNGCSPLMKALERRKLPCLNLLIRAGADVNTVNSRRHTPLMLAVLYARQPQVSITPCIMLLKAGAHINIRNNRGRNALEESLSRYPHHHEKLQLLLLAAGEIIGDVSLVTRDEFGNTTVKLLPDYLQFAELKLCLKHMCRQAIRNHLLHLDPHRHLFYRIPQMGLDEILSSYLLYDVSLEDDDNQTDQCENTTSYAIDLFHNSTPPSLKPRP